MVFKFYFFLLAFFIFNVPVFLALAQNPEDARQQYRQALLARKLLNAEWEKLRNTQSQRPIISQTSIDSLEDNIKRFRKIIDAGGWPRVDDSEILVRGSKGKAVSQLRRRLKISGDYGKDDVDNEEFDLYLHVALRRFQLRHGLISDGIAGAATFAHLNVPAEQRLRQLEISLKEIQKLHASFEQKHVLVNIPGAEIEVVENGKVVQRHTAVVGKPDRQTPILSSNIFELNLNPYWTMPQSIIVKDLIPKMREDPEYLKKFHIRIFDGKGREVKADKVNWESDKDATRYRFRQDPGKDNSLGRVRVNFHNAHQVYLHDTPLRELFGRDDRLHSSGCVRVSDIDGFIDWLSRQNADDSNELITDAIASGAQKNIALHKPVPLHMVYVTAWAASENVVFFRDDVYNRLGLNGGEEEGKSEQGA